MLQILYFIKKQNVKTFANILGVTMKLSKLVVAFES